MTSTIQRQRAAARARLERQMAERLEDARKRKQVRAVFGAVVALVLVAGGTIWLVSALSGNSKDPVDAAAPPPPADAACSWVAEQAGANPNLKDVGAPPTGKAADKGSQVMTITTNVGVIEAKVDTAKAPCTAASMTFLAGKKFFDNTKCHRLVTDGIKVLQCGDPSGTGMGGPTYKMAEENLPNVTDPTKNYPAGTIAMANTGQPNSTGSQFFIVYGDTALDAKYSVLGTVTKGLDVVQKIGAAGAVDPKGKPAANGDGAPKNPVTIKSITIAAPVG